MGGPYRTLIGTENLVRRLGDPAWVVVDCRFTVGDPGRGLRDFALARIPGARYAHLETALAAPPASGTGRHPLPQADALAALLGRLGIDTASQVVVYDDSFGSVAARLWWLLRWVGHEAAALLDGGWPRWKRLRLPLDAAAPHLPAATPPYPVRTNAGMLVDAALVDRVRLSDDWRILDARPEERFSGERESLDPVAGHIPGSLNRPFEDNLQLDGRFQSAGALRREFLAHLGDAPPGRTIHTCGSGVTACHNVLAMEHAGLYGSKLYAGSWSEWIADPGRPIAVGLD